MDFVVAENLVKLKCLDTKKVQCEKIGYSNTITVICLNKKQNS